MWLLRIPQIVLALFLFGCVWVFSELTELSVEALQFVAPDPDPDTE